MTVKMVWQFLKMLPFFIDLFKHIKDKYGDATVDYYTQNFMKEVKGKNRASVKAKYLNSMFK